MKEVIFIATESIPVYNGYLPSGRKVRIDKNLIVIELDEDDANHLIQNTEVFMDYGEFKKAKAEADKGKSKEAKKTASKPRKTATKKK